MRDPDVGFEWLTAWIRTDLPVPDAVEHISELDENWFCDKLEIVGDLLNFNLG